MPKPKVPALVMAGGEGNRLELLTERRAKPALPFAGVYRLIDFPLSNCLHSGIEDVWVLQQYRLQSLNDQLANGRPWDLDRTHGGLRLLPPQLGTAEEGFHEGNGDGELKDFGHGLLPRLVEAGEAFEYRMAGYWRDVGTVPAYWQAHMDLLDPARPLDLDDPAWPVLGRAQQRLPARVEGSARLERALLSPGTVVAGEVVRSVLGPGVVVEPGASVRDAVLLDDCVIAAGARVEWAVLDRDVRVGPDARVGGAGADGQALVGEQARVPGGATVGPGGRFGHDGPEEATG
jgi:ADP-glucose pyrophosphorylase